MFGRIRGGVRALAIAARIGLSPAAVLFGGLLRRSLGL